MEGDLPPARYQTNLGDRHAVEMARVVGSHDVQMWRTLYAGHVGDLVLELDRPTRAWLRAWLDYLDDLGD